MHTTTSRCHRNDCAASINLLGRHDRLPYRWQNVTVPLDAIRSNIQPQSRANSWQIPVVAVFLTKPFTMADCRTDRLAHVSPPFLEADLPDVTKQTDFTVASCCFCKRHAPCRYSCKQEAALSFCPSTSLPCQYFVCVQSLYFYGFGSKQWCRRCLGLVTYKYRLNSK